MLTKDFSKPRTTTRALVDPSRKCALRCEFCYYLPNDDLHTVHTWEEQKKMVLDAVASGCNCCDVSGGEPLQQPHVVELIQFCADNGLPARIISSLVCSEKVFDGVLNAGVEDWLISMHGAKHETHNEIVHVKGARAMQEKRIAKIADRMDWCANYVMVEKNQTEMVDLARWLIAHKRPPKILNFILFNVFGPWLKSPEWIEKGKANVIDPRIAGPILGEAIDLLEAAGIGVNVRYAPMCMMAERHRKNICNDLHVAYDAGEWANAFGARTDPGHVLRNYAIPLSNRNEEKGAPCNTCSHHGVCGGANRIWHQLAVEKFGTEVLVPLTGPKINDHWKYRAMNVMGLDPRRNQDAMSSAHQR